MQNQHQRETYGPKHTTQCLLDSMLGRNLLVLASAWHENATLAVMAEVGLAQNLAYIPSLSG